METEIRTFRNLDAWKRGMDIVLAAYKVADKLPASERYELSAQIRRAAVSVPSNVAEGHERRNRGYLHHLRIALGSLAELDTQIEVALRVGFLQQVDVSALVNEIAIEGRLLHGLRRSVWRQILAKAAPGGAILLGCLIASAFPTFRLSDLPARSTPATPVRSILETRTGAPRARPAAPAVPILSMRAT